MFKYYKLTKVLYPEILIKRRNCFDYYNITLGDLMRRERDTKFKSTTDIWLELRLCNPYVLTIKNGLCVWYSKACFRLCHVPPRYVGTKLYKELDIFCMETDFEFFWSKNITSKAMVHSNKKIIHGLAIKFSQPVRLHLIQKDCGTIINFFIV